MMRIITNKIYANNDELLFKAWYEDSEGWSAAGFSRAEAIGKLLLSHSECEIVRLDIGEDHVEIFKKPPTY